MNARNLCAWTPFNPLDKLPSSFDTEEEECLGRGGIVVVGLATERRWWFSLALVVSIFLFGRNLGRLTVVEKGGTIIPLLIMVVNLGRPFWLLGHQVTMAFHGLTLILSCSLPRHRPGRQTILSLKKGL